MADNAETPITTNDAAVEEPSPPTADEAAAIEEPSPPSPTQINEDQADSVFVVETPAPKPKKTKQLSSSVSASDETQQESVAAEEPPPEPNQTRHNFGSSRDTLFLLENPVQDGEQSLAKTEYVSTLYTGNNEPLYTGDSCRISCKYDRHLSYLYIEITDKDTRKGYEENILTSSGLLFPYNAFPTPGQLKALGNAHEHQDNKECTRFCYELILPLSMDSVGVENILVPEPPEAVVTLKNYLKLAKTTVDLKLKVHICMFADHNQLPQSLNELQDMMLKAGPSDHLIRWRHPEKRRFVIQHNEFIPPTQRPRPSYRIQTRTIFFNMAEYLIFMCIGDLEQYESDSSALAAYRGTVHDLFLASIPGGGDRIYLAIFRTPNNAPRLQEGEVIQVMHQDTTDPETALRATVTATLPGIPLHYTTAWLKMRWDSEATEFNTGPFDIEPAHILKFKPGAMTLNEADILRCKALQAELNIPLSDKSYRHRVAGIAAFHDHLVAPPVDSDTPAVLQVLLGSDIDSVHTYDVYAGISKQVPEVNTYMTQLNAGQMECIQLARAAPAGFVLVQGPPGTGKSFTGVHLAWPFVEANTEFSGVLCVAASNGCVDSDAVKFDKKMRQMVNWNGQYVVRAYSVETELEIARQYGLVQRPKPTDARPEFVNTLDEEAVDALELMSIADVVYKSYKEQHKTSIPLIHDTRVSVQGLALSIGYRLMQLIGKHSCAAQGDPLLPVKVEDRSTLSELKEKYNQFCANVTFNKKEAAQFSALLRKGRAIVLGNAAVICTTPALACEAKIYSVYRDAASALVFDEAGRVSEPTALAILGLYPWLTLKALLGDNQQLQTLIKDKKQQVFFQDQYARSLLDRLMAAGVPYRTLLLQYRMCPDLARVVSRFGYRGKLIDDDSVKHENRPQQAALRQWNKVHFARERSVIYMNVHFTSQDKKNICGTHVIDGGSRVNEVFVVLGIELAKKLMDAAPGTSIAILTGYNAQLRLYLHAKSNLVRKDTKYSKLAIMTFDASQGMEFDIVVCDFLVNDSAGFLNHHARVNVAISRAKYAFYAMVNREAITATNSASLRRFQSEIIQLGTEAKVPLPDGSDLFTATDFRLLTGLHTQRIGRETTADGNGATDGSTSQGDQGWDAAVVVTEGNTNQPDQAWDSTASDAATISGKW